MKLVKQLLSMLLAMLLAIVLLLPAVHAEEMEAAAQEIAAQDAPVITITKQPAAFTKTLTNKEITLSVEAKIPEGVDGTLRYQWYQMDGGVAVALAGETFPALRLRLMYDDSEGFRFLKSADDAAAKRYYQVVITCDYTEDGQDKNVDAASEIAEIYAYPSAAEYFRSVWRYFTSPIHREAKTVATKITKVIMITMLTPLSIFILLLSPMVVFVNYLFFWLK